MTVRFLVLALLFSLALGSVTPSKFAHAADTTAVQAQIEEHNKKIQALDQEIAQYQKQLNTVTTQKQTLQSAIKTIDLTKAKTTAQIGVTQNKIVAADLTIDKLGDQILTKEQTIDLDKKTIAASLREIARYESVSPIVALVSSETLVDAWAQIDAQGMVNSKLQAHIDVLATDKEQLAGQQSQVVNTKDQLTQLSTTLVTQKGQLEATEKSKQQLLTATKNQESNYQALIATKKAQQKAFEKELTTLENSLKSVSSSQIPHAGQGILAWPFSDSVMQNCKGKSGALGNPYCITQYFGNTAFAMANASVYNGMGHNAIDIGIPTGTPVQSALSGTVLGTGNTDSVPGCYSFGKWVVVKHANGLATLYSHLSQISVSSGQAVSTGDVLGYSGMTGYATGPHLHFGVYASAGIKITTLQEYRGATSPCARATMPVSPTNGYLNPLSYL